MVGSGDLRTYSFWKIWKIPFYTLIDFLFNISTTEVKPYMKLYFKINGIK